jgi:hypothetical protein
VSVRLWGGINIELFAVILVTTGNAKCSINVLRKLDTSFIRLLRNTEMEMAISSLRHICVYKNKYGYTRRLAFWSETVTIWKVYSFEFHVAWSSWVLPATTSSHSPSHLIGFIHPTRVWMTESESSLLQAALVSSFSCLFVISLWTYSPFRIQELSPWSRVFL